MSPSRARFVSAARNPSAVHPSSIGSSARPTLRIWKKWSITQIESKPTSSAWLAMRPSVGPMASGPPGHVKEEIWRPSFMGMLRWAGESEADYQAADVVGCKMLLASASRCSERKYCI